MQKMFWNVSFHRENFSAKICVKLNMQFVVQLPSVVENIFCIAMIPGAWHGTEVAFKVLIQLTGHVSSVL